MASVSFSEGFQRHTGGFKGNIGALMNTGEYYVTPEICREYRHIDNGIDHLRLDNTFLKSSDWRSKFSPDNLQRERSGANQMVEKAKFVSHDIMGRTSNNETKGILDNERRQVHDWTIQTSKGMQKDMGPYVHSSANRIRQFCDHIGVTDRYTGYRNGLNRINRDPVNLGNQWLDSKSLGNNVSQRIGWRSDPSQTYNADYTPQPNVRSAPPLFLRGGNSFQGPVAERQEPAPKPTLTLQIPRGERSRSIQERCGININYPGTTEMKDRYRGPPEESGVLPFVINPSPDFSRSGRPLMKLQHLQGKSEYEDHYVWPNGNLIDTKPWARQ